MPSVAVGGYASSQYAHSLAEFGEPLSLHRSVGWILATAIPNSCYRDAFGPYPLFAAEHPELLVQDFAELPRDLVSLYVVADPLREDQLPAYELAFDFVRPYKLHYVVDLSITFDKYLGYHHRRYAARALEQIQVILANDPAAFATEWTDLYGALCARHSITGMRRFSRPAFDAQLRVPGCHYFRAFHGEELVGGLVCYLDRGRAYGHLISTTALGQRLLAQYALYWTAIEYFRGCATTLHLGGLPDEPAPEKSRLAFFKSRWSTSTRMAHFCGRILNRKIYDCLTDRAGSKAGDLFPAYRSGILGES
jgi:hypothetical protein